MEDQQLQYQYEFINVVNTLLIQFNFVMWSDVACL